MWGKTGVWSHLSGQMAAVSRESGSTEQVRKAVGNMAWVKRGWWAGANMALVGVKASLAAGRRQLGMARESK